MIRNYVRTGLLFLAAVFLLTIFYYSGLDTKSYNTNEDYSIDLGGGMSEQESRIVLVTENANAGSTVVALGIIVGACLIGVSVLSNSDSDKKI